MSRSHVPLPDDLYRLPSGRIVRVLEVLWRDGERVAACVYAVSGQALTLSARMLVERAWRLA